MTLTNDRRYISIIDMDMDNLAGEKGIRAGCMRALIREPEQIGESDCDRLPGWAFQDAVRDPAAAAARPADHEHIPARASLSWGSARVEQMLFDTGFEDGRCAWLGGVCGGVLRAVRGRSHEG